MLSLSDIVGRRHDGSTIWATANSLVMPAAKWPADFRPSNQRRQLVCRTGG